MMEILVGLALMFGGIAWINGSDQEQVQKEVDDLNQVNIAEEKKEDLFEYGRFHKSIYGYYITNLMPTQSVETCKHSILIKDLSQPTSSLNSTILVDDQCFDGERR